MDSSLYNDVHQLSLDIVNASEVGDTKSKWDAYQSLKQLCELNENSDRNHPLQWEALADFTINDSQAIKIYRRALAYANQLNLNEYSASITFEIATRYYQSGNRFQALALAKQSDKLAKSTNNLELRKEISEFLQRS